MKKYKDQELPKTTHTQIRTYHHDQHVPVSSGLGSENTFSCIRKEKKDGEYTKQNNHTILDKQQQTPAQTNIPFHHQIWMVVIHVDMYMYKSLTVIS